MEKVVSSAIKFYRDNDVYPTIMADRRHSDVFNKMRDMHIDYDRETCIQGFLTDNNRFVDRYEAKRIAVAADQLIVPAESTSAVLYSEDVW